MCTLDTGLRLIMTWWAGSMRGWYSLLMRRMFQWNKPVSVFICVHRFILSLASCQNCVVIDDQLNILPISSHMANIKPVPAKTQVSVLQLFSPSDQHSSEMDTVNVN